MQITHAIERHLSQPKKEEDDEDDDEQRSSKEGKAQIIVKCHCLRKCSRGQKKLGVMRYFKSHF